MEYADGWTLKDYIENSGKNEEGLKREEVFSMFMQLMHALKHIHSNNLVHRDIKPDNIFVNKHTKKLLIGDFGLAKDLNNVHAKKSKCCAQKMPKGLSKISSVCNLDQLANGKQLGK